MKLVSGTSILEISTERLLHEYQELALTLYRISQTNPAHTHLLQGIVALATQVLSEQHQLYEQREPVKVICAWCSCHLDGDPDALTISHGFCATCSAQQQRQRLEPKRSAA